MVGKREAVRPAFLFWKDIAECKPVIEYSYQQVETLPAAVALNGISYNIARSTGPAIGGVVVAAAGAMAAFTLNAMLYLPLIAALFLWKRVAESPRLPPEKLRRAIISGVMSSR